MPAAEQGHGDAQAVLGDMYAKGASMLHTIRQLVDDDEQWRGLLRGLNRDFFHSTVTTQQIEQYMIEYTGLDLQHIFDQYLRTVNIPTLEYYVEEGKLYFRWINAVPDFNMPVKVWIDDSAIMLEPLTTWKSILVAENSGQLIIDPDYFAGKMNTFVN